jgi:tight adherence protein B
MNTIFRLIVVFVLVSAITGLLLYIVPWGSWRVRRRLREIDEPASKRKQKKDRRDPFPAVSRALEKRGYLDPLTRQLARAGWDMRASEFAVLNVAAAVVPMFAVWMLTRSAPFSLVALILGGVFPYFAARVAQGQRLKKFETQLPDGLILIASSLRSGYGFMRAVQVLTQEMEPPISNEFRKTLEEVNVGIPTEEALHHMAERVDSYDLELTVSAVSMQLQVGGNLASLLETIAETVRERQRIRAEISTLTAEARLSGVILFCLPLAMLAIISFLNPGYVGPLIKSQLGHLLVGAAIAFQGLGGLIMYRMLQLEI